MLIAGAGCARHDAIEEPVYFSLRSPPDRAASSFDVTVATGFCAGDDIETRLGAPAIRTEPTAFIVTFIQVSEGDGVCHGVGTETAARLELPAPLGDRALVTDAGSANFLRILVPPRGRDAIRGLGRREGFAYIGDACDAVAQQLKDRPKDEWCLY
jgi:hypothetical protein